MPQQILIIGTRKPTLRDAVQQARLDSSDNITVEAIERWPPAVRPTAYGTPLHAIADGWTLLGVPQKDGYWSDDGVNTCLWEWWFSKSEGKRK